MAESALYLNRLVCIFITTISILSAVLFGTLILEGIIAGNSGTSFDADAYFSHYDHRKILANYMESELSAPANFTITIFTVPTRPFANISDDHQLINDPQYKAIESWLMLVPNLKVILLGNDSSFYRISERFDGQVSVEPNIDHNLRGTPQLHSIFARAEVEDADITMFVSIEAQLRQDTVIALQRTMEAHENWVLISKADRRDVPQFAGRSAHGAIELWAWNRESSNNTRNSNSSKVHSLMVTPMPPFSHVIGTYDSWILHHLAKERAVVDATQANIMTVEYTKPQHMNRSTAWEAYINSMLGSSDRGEAGYPVAAAPRRIWKLIRCDEVRVHNLCMIDQSRTVELADRDEYKSVKGSKSSGSIMTSRGTEVETPETDQRPEWPQAELWKKAGPGLPHTLEELLPQVADENRVVVMVGGTSNYMEMLMSFTCMVKGLGVENVLVAAFDETLFEYAYTQGLAVYYESYAEDYRGPIRSDGQCVFNSLCFQHVSKLKSWSVLRVLRRGYTVLWSDMDIVWFRNPVRDLLAAFGPGTLPIQSDEEDPRIPANNFRGANSGFYLARADEATIRAFRAIVGHAMTTELTEQPSFYHVLCGEQGERRVGDNECTFEGLRTIFLSRDEYPNGAVFGHWLAPDPAQSCKARGCMLLHNNYISGKPEKIRRQIVNGMWYFDVHRRMCLQPWNPLSPSKAALSDFQTHFLPALHL